MFLQITTLGCGFMFLQSCQTNQPKQEPKMAVNDSVNVDTSNTSLARFQYLTDQFADIRILRYRVPEFEKLSLQQKELMYYLSEAALSGRDIIWDQHYKYNLTIRKVLENIMASYKGDKKSEDYQKFLVYTKQVWFSNGIHHHYNSTKILPEFKPDFFASLIQQSDVTSFPYKSDENTDAFIARLTPLLFDSTIAPKMVNLNPKEDMIATSATNFYEGLTQKEAQDFYAAKTDKKNPRPVMIGLNSKLLKENGKVTEKVWKIGSMYTQAIEKMVYWIEKAIPVAENDLQKDALVKLVKYYKSGDLKDFDEYCIAWVKDTASMVDVVNGFIEVYGDPLGYKGSFESAVSVKDLEVSKRIKAIGAQAQWFEDHSPIMDAHKKKKVKGIDAKVINVVMECGDAAPSTPIGINLPNNEWIRETHGSKSVNLGNIMDAYSLSAGGNIVEEFYYGKEVQDRVKELAPLADKLHTDMHEVIGHASGQINPGVGQPAQTLKNYASTLEEARADLVALYYLYDPKLVELGVMKSQEYGKSSYDEYITKGLLVQLARVKLGKDLEEAHMRNRHLVASWVYEKGTKENVIEKKVESNKTYYVINDYAKLRVLFGQLLKEIQRIKSEGDYKAGRELVEKYGVKIDQQLHREVLERYGKLNIAPYAGFIQPKLVPVMEGDKIIDVKIEYPPDFVEQMIYYGKNYSFLPLEN